MGIVLPLLLADIAAAECPAEPAGGVIYACANKRTGLLRCITAVEACRKNERMLTWNVQGLSAARGTQGTPGLGGSLAELEPEGAPGVPVTGPESSGAIRGRLAFCSESAEELDAYIPGTSFHAITDGEGRFVLSYVPIGIHELKFRRNGVALDGVPAVQVLDSQLTDVGTVQLTALDTNQNCGTCNNTCTPPAVCLAGTCTTVCPAGLATCGDACVFLATDEDNCGSCGNVCEPPPNTFPSCNQGTCSFYCSGSYGNCDGTLANGCETPIHTELRCTGCDQPCPVVPNGRERCYYACTGVPFYMNCVYGCGPAIVCDPGYGNCDNNDANGCETSLRTISSCGGCGLACRIGQFCNAKGACEDGTGR